METTIAKIAKIAKINRRNKTMGKDDAVAVPQQGGPLTDAEAFEKVDVKYGWEGGAWDKVSLPTTGGGKFLYKTSGKMVDAVSFKLATAYWKRFYNVEVGDKSISVCYSDNAKSGRGKRLGQDGETRVDVDCEDCPQNKIPNKDEIARIEKETGKKCFICKPTYVLEWDEDVNGKLTRMRMYLSYSAQKEFGVYSQSLESRGIDVRNAVTVMEAKRGKKGSSDYLFAGFRLGEKAVDEKKDLTSAYNALTTEQKAVVGDYMKKAFNVATVDKLNDVQQGLLLQEVLKLSNEAPKAPPATKGKTPF